MTHLLECILISLTTLLDNGTTYLSPSQTELEMSPKVVESWIRAGAEFGFMDYGQYQIITFNHSRDTTTAIPAFKFESRPGGLFQQLPQPKVPFGLSLQDFKINEEQLKQLRNLDNLRFLKITPADDAAKGLSYLSELKNLKSIFLYPKPSTVGFQQLAKLKSLETLVFIGDIFQDQDMDTLSNLSNLRSLTLIACTFEENQLKPIRKLKNLNYIDLRKTTMDDGGLSHLAVLTKLEHLCLKDVLFDEIDLKHLSNLKQLKTLSLRGTSITDRGLKQLGALKNLEYLDLSKKV